MVKNGAFEDKWNYIALSRIELVLNALLLIALSRPELFRTIVFSLKIISLSWA
jgi:hypothetical protein